MKNGDKIIQYWDEQPATISGILGGYENINKPDILTSQKMLEKTRAYISGYNTALDCGAGIGRVSEAVLIPTFDTVDLLE